MSLAIVLTLSVLIIFTVFGVAFAYVIFLASDKASHHEAHWSDSTVDDFEDVLSHKG